MTWADVMEIEVRDRQLICGLGEIIRDDSKYCMYPFPADAVTAGTDVYLHSDGDENM